MTTWDISASGVVAVLTEVNVPAEALGESLKGLEGAVSAAVTATQSGAISEAIQNYFQQEEGPRIQAMNTRIGAAASGVVNATQSYVDGDTTMAQAHQNAAIDQVYPPTPAPGHGPVAY
jgi:hypothetical protein